MEGEVIVSTSDEFYQPEDDEEPFFILIPFVLVYLLIRSNKMVIMIRRESFWLGDKGVVDHTGL